MFIFICIHNAGSSEWRMPFNTEFNDCRYAAWVRSWWVAENCLYFRDTLRLFIQSPPAERAFLPVRPTPVAAMLYWARIPHPMGATDLVVDIHGRAQGPQAGWPLPPDNPDRRAVWLDDRPAIAAAIAQITAEHQPIGANVTDHRLLQLVDDSHDLCASAAADTSSAVASTTDAKPRNGPTAGEAHRAGSGTASAGPHPLARPSPTAAPRHHPRTGRDAFALAARAAVIKTRRSRLSSTF